MIRQALAKLFNRSSDQGAAPSPVKANASLAGGPYATNPDPVDPNFAGVKALPSSPAPMDLAQSLAGPVGLNLSSVKSGASQWREWLDPLIALGPWRVWSIERASQLGMWADFQWLLRFVIREDGLMLSLVSRWEAEVSQLEWDVEPLSKDELPPGCTIAEAEEQAQVLRRCYRQIGNLRDALKFLALAKFHHFSHLEIITDHLGNVCELSPVRQWHWKQRGENGDWYYDESAYQSFAGVAVDPATIVVRTVEHYVGRVCLRYYLAKNGGQRCWQQFVEIYNLHNFAIIGPPNVPKEMEAEYRSAAERMTQTGGAGYLPNGSDVTQFDPPSQTPPAPAYIEHWKAELTLAVTGGLLTSLAVSGSGTLAGGAHADTFAKLAGAEGVDIAACLDQQLSPRMIEPNFPGRPKLCRFVLRIKQEVDASSGADTIAKISQAGFDVDPAQVTEITGLKVTKKAPPPQLAAPGNPNSGPSSDPSAPSDSSSSGSQSSPGQMLDQIIRNRAQATAADKLGRAFASDLAPVRNDLARILDIADPDEQLAAARELMDGLPDQLEKLGADPEAAKVLIGQMRSAFAEGVKDGGVK